MHQVVQKDITFEVEKKNYFVLLHHYEVTFKKLIRHFILITKSITSGTGLNMKCKRRIFFWTILHVLKKQLLKPIYNYGNT